MPSTVIIESKQGDILLATKANQKQMRIKSSISSVNDRNLKNMDAIQSQS